MRNLDQVLRLALPNRLVLLNPVLRLALRNRLVLPNPVLRLALRNRLVLPNPVLRLALRNRLVLLNPALRLALRNLKPAPKHRALRHFRSITTPGNRTLNCAIRSSRAFKICRTTGIRIPHLRSFVDATNMH
jgi:hypothetical protein